MGPLLSLTGVGKRYRSQRGDEVQALEGVTLDVAEGEFVSLIGPSGCGKSTLLRIVAGLDTASEGTVAWQRERTGRADIGFVFQDPVLLPWKNVLDNARFPLDVFHAPRQAADERVRGLLENVGLAGFERALPKELSGGMRQRVSIVRALSYDPPLLLMDEPFGALDLLTRDHLNDELLRIWSGSRKTVLFVTHSVEEAAYLSDRVVVMSARPGRVQAVHEVELPRPRGPETKLAPTFHELMASLRRELG